MLLTAEEAKAKYCCQDITKKCRAEDCMGWTWYEIEKIATGIKDEINAQGKEVLVQQYKEIHRGYCGHLNEPRDIKEHYGSE